MIRQWHRLILFLDDGNIELTNNRRERELRRLVQGRKNWLLRGKTSAASASQTSSPSSPRASRTTSTRAPTSISSPSSSFADGPRASSLIELLPDQLRRAHPELALLPSEDELLLGD
jgi:hypothetical protein